MGTLAGLCSFAVAFHLAAGNEAESPTRIVAADLFKNGLAIVKREVVLEAGRIALVGDIPPAVHGTLWFEGDGVEASVGWREVQRPTPILSGDIQQDFAGREATLRLRNSALPMVRGRIVSLPSPAPLAASSSSEPTQIPFPRASIERPSRFIVVETDKGRVYVDPSEIIAVEAASAQDVAMRREPVLRIQKKDKQPGVVRFSYLAFGLSWAPSYQLDVSDPKRMTIRQSAVVRNELADFRDAEVSLISGYPNIEFSNVRSILAPGQTWAAFFNQLSQPSRFNSPITANAASQVTYQYQPPGGNAESPIAAPPAGEGVDLHFHSIGKRSIAVNESTLLELQRAGADYQRIVEWNVPDAREESGPTGRQVYRGNPSQSDDATPWDCLQFRNPFVGPMTTAPALVSAGGRFQGQHQLSWVNPKEETRLRVNKALSIRAERTEREEGGAGRPRELLDIAGRRFARSTIQGELRIGNSRRESVVMHIVLRLTGEIVKADAEPKIELIAVNVDSFNARNKLAWRTTLAAGEERKIAYRYTLLTPF